MIRPLAAPDREPVLALLCATGNFSAPEIDIAAELIDIVLTRSDQRDYYAFVHDDGARPVGLLIVGPVPATVGAWHLYWIAVHPDHQGTAVGGALAAHAESFVRDHNGYLILVETSSQPAYDRARRFYAKHGYEQLVRVPDYYRPGDDLILLARRFPL
jgi:ribosomal protein S18 acetylase RimI-like enzyme